MIPGLRTSGVLGSAWNGEQSMGCRDLGEKEERMDREIRKYTWAGILWTVVVGSLSHFVYHWTGQNFLAGLFTPVNETVWEHLKLLFFPALLYMLWERSRVRDWYPDMFCKDLLGLWAGMLLIPLGFYSYTFLAGRNYLWADIGLFILSVLLTFWIPYKWRDQELAICRTFWNYRILLLLLITFLVLSVYFMRIQG